MFTHDISLTFTLEDMLRFFKNYGFETYKPNELYLEKLYKQEKLDFIKETYLYWVKDKKGNPVGPVEVIFTKFVKVGILSNLSFLGMQFDKEDYYDKPPKKTKSKKAK